MKFLAEQDVPEALRILRPLVQELVEELPPPEPDPLPQILRTLVDMVMKKDSPRAPSLDLTPIVEAIRAMPRPAPAAPLNLTPIVEAIRTLPAPAMAPATAAKEWTFTIQRNSDGAIETVHAQQNTVNAKRKGRDA